MNAINRVFGTAIGFAMVAAFTAGIITLVLSLASEQLPGIKAIGAELRCVAGIPADGSPCVSEKMAELDAQRRALVAERDGLAEKAADHEARQRELEALNRTVENYSQFQSVSRSFGTITTGVEFASVLEPEVWSKTWCYLTISVSGALSRRVDLGDQEAGKSIRWETITPRQRGDLGLSAEQIDEAKSLCTFADLP